MPLKVGGTQARWRLMWHLAWLGPISFRPWNSLQCR